MGPVLEEERVHASDHGAVLHAALRAAVDGDVGPVPELFTEDVRGWSPNLVIASRDELLVALLAREDALSEVEVSVEPIDVIGDKAIAEWVVTAVFSGPFPIGDDVVIQPNGQEIMLGGAIAADFTGDKISAFRNYFDDVTLLVQMLSE